MTASHDSSGDATPSFGQSSGPDFHAGHEPIGSYSGRDFPAPEGVPPVGSHPSPESSAHDQRLHQPQAHDSRAPYQGAPYQGGPYQGGPHQGGQDQGTQTQGSWHQGAQHHDAGATSTVQLPRRPRRRGGVVLAAAALSAVVGAGAGIGSYTYLAGGSSGAVAAPISVTTKPAANTPVLDGTISAAAKQIEPSVVTITVRAAQGEAIGTGVVLDKNGHILTNDHVVSDLAQGQQGQGQQGQDPQGQTSSSQISVTFDDGTTEKAEVVGTSNTNDLAVIKVAANDTLVPATFATSGSVRVGQAVVAVGAPLGLSDTVTSGIVSNTARPVRSGSDNDAVYLAVQTDAAINPGNSGGPLVNLNGDVVGINSSIAGTGSDSSGGQSGNIGIGFAIPADVVTRVASELIANGSYANAALGVTVGGQDSQLVSTDGVTLQSVTADGAAAKAGLEAGDQVTKVNDFSTTTADGLIAATRYYAPGTTVQVTYTRSGQSHTAQVTLGTA